MVAFKRDRILPPLPLAAVQPLLELQGGAPRLPQKLPAHAVGGA